MKTHHTRAASLAAGPALCAILLTGCCPALGRLSQPPAGPAVRIVTATPVPAGPAVRIVTATPAQPSAPAPTSMPAPAPTAAPQVPQTTAQLQLLPPTALQSYRQRGSATINQGDSYRLVSSIFVEYSSRSEGCRLVISEDQTVSPYGRVEGIDMGGYTYERQGPAAWERRPTNPAISLLRMVHAAAPDAPTEGQYIDLFMYTRPELAVTSGATGRYVGTETVAGVPCWHYHYDGPALQSGWLARYFSTSQGAQTSGQADAWVSVAQHVVLRFSCDLVTQPSGQPPTSARIEFDRMDIGAAITIEAPQVGSQ